MALGVHIQDAAYSFEIYLLDHPSTHSVIEILGQLQAEDAKGAFKDLKASANWPLLRCGPDSIAIHFNADLSKRA
jgi:hypothetical protein